MVLPHYFCLVMEEGKMHAQHGATRAKDDSLRESTETSPREGEIVHMH